MFFGTMLQLQMQLFLLMIIGYICTKIKLISKEAQGSLSDILIYVVLPCNIIAGFTSGIAVDRQLLINSISALVISLVIQLIATYGSKIIFKKWPGNKAQVASYGMIVSNSSFIGIPVMQCLYGNMGVLLTAIFQIPIRFTMWSAGLAIFTDVDKKTVVKKVLLHPCIIACFIGFEMMLMQISFPGFLGDTVAALSHCTGPLSMLVIGSILAGVDVRNLFDRYTIMFVLLRLIIYPMVVLAALNIIHVDATLTGVSVLLTGMPAGSTCAILARKYRGDAEYGASLIFVSTLFSIVTLPIIALLF